MRDRGSKKRVYGIICMCILGIMVVVVVDVAAVSLVLVRPLDECE